MLALSESVRAAVVIPVFTVDQTEINYVSADAVKK